MKTKFKKTTRLLLVSLAVMVSVTFAQAQQQGRQQGPPPLPNDEQIEEMVADLSEELSLTDYQEKQVSSVYFSHFDDVSEMIENSNARPDRQVMEQMKDDFETEVKSYMDKDQQKLFDAYQKEQQSQRGGQGRPGQ